jgi:hypothetical protein
MGNGTRQRKPQHTKRVGKEKLRYNDHPATTPQQMALIRLQCIEARKRKASSTTTEEK